MSKTLDRLWRDSRRKIGLRALQGLAGGAVLGLITYFAGRQGAGFTVVSSLLFGLVVAFASFVGALVLATGALESRLATAQATATVMSQKTGAHRAIYAWVDACEVSLRDHGQALPDDARVTQELIYLKANVLNSLAGYAFYPDSLTEQVKKLADGEPGEPESIRLARLLAQLRKNLEAGSYLL